jgi:hypothetical protein
MPVKQSVITAVAILNMVDMSIANMICPSEFEHNTTKIEFDKYEGTETMAIKGSFAKQSNIVAKDGYSTVTVNPMEINESIFSGVADVTKKQIGKTIYGELLAGMSEAEIKEIEDDMEGFSKLVKRSQRLLKKSIYDVATAGEIVVSGKGEAEDKISYGFTNKIVNDNATAGQYQWNDTTNSNPVKQLEEQAEGSKEAIDTYVLGFEATKAWRKHPQVTKTDASGNRENFTPATKEERASKSTKYMQYLGSTNGNYGKPVEVYYEFEQYTDESGSSQFYLNKNYVVGFENGNTANMQRHYGAIARSAGGADNNANKSMELYVGKELLTANMVEDPDGIKRRYRTSPLVTMNKPSGFISIKATLIS